MTYRELIATLTTKIPDERLDDNVTVYSFDQDEYLPATNIVVADEENGVLDDGHIYLVI